MTLWSFTIGGSHHCSIKCKLLLFLQDRFSLTEGSPECTTPSALTFEFHSYVRQVLKRFFFKIQAWVLHTARDKAHFCPVFYDIFFRTYLYFVWKGELPCDGLPQYLQNTVTVTEDREDQDCPRVSPGFCTIDVSKDETFVESSWFKKDV